MNRQRARVVLPALGVAALVAAGVWYEVSRRNGDAAGTLSGNGTIEATEVDLASRIAGRLVTVVPPRGRRGAAGAGGRGPRGRGAGGAGRPGAREPRRGRGGARRPGRRVAHRGDRAPARRRRRRRRTPWRRPQARLDLLKAGTRVEQLEQARAALRQAQAAFDDAEREARRVETLVAQGAVPGRDLDQATARRDGARALLDAARQRQAEAEAGARVEEVQAAQAAVAGRGSQARAAQAAVDLAVAGPRRETLQSAAARVEAARGALAAAESLLAQTRILAPAAAA